MVSGACGTALAVAHSGIVAIGGAYYLVLGYVLARSVDRRDRRSTACALSVLVANEAWNVALFGRRILYDIPWIYRLWPLNPELAG